MGRSRRRACISAAGLACICAAGMATAQNIVRLDKDSAFYNDLRAEPVPGDPAELILKAQLFDKGQSSTDGTDLEHWLDRVRILELLGEPLPWPAPRTIGEAIASERSAPESYDKLRHRAREAVLKVERASDSKAGDFQYDGKIAYLGNGVWQGGATNRRLWIRVKATNESSRAIDLFGIVHEADRGRALDFSVCTLEGGGSLAPKATRYAVCLNAVDLDRTPVAMRAVTADVLVPALRVSRIEMADMRLSEHGDTLPYSLERMPKASRQADEILAKVPCERLNSCAQVAANKTAEAKRQYEQSPEYFEKQRAERSARGATRLHWGLALMLALTAGFAAIPRLGDEPVEGWGTGAAAFAIFPFGVLVVMCAKAILEETEIARGYGGYVVFIGGLAAAAVMAVLLIGVGVKIADPDRRTRMRLAAMGFGLGALAILASVLVPT